MRRVIARQSATLAVLMSWLKMSAFITSSTCCETDWMAGSKCDEIDSGVRSNLGRGEVAQLIPPNNDKTIPTNKNLFFQREWSRERKDSLTALLVGFNTGGSNGGVCEFKCAGTEF